MQGESQRRSVSWSHIYGILSSSTRTRKSKRLVMNFRNHVCSKCSISAYQKQRSHMILRNIHTSFDTLITIQTDVLYYCALSSRVTFFWQIIYQRLLTTTSAVCRKNSASQVKQMAIEFNILTLISDYCVLPKVHSIHTQGSQHTHTTTKPSFLFLNLNWGKWTLVGWKLHRTTQNNTDNRYELQHTL